MTDQTVLKLDKINKSFAIGKNRINVLKDIDLSIKKGEFNCVIGPNGSGKTTLIKIISGIENQSSGTYQKTGEVAYLPQQDSLLPWFSLRKNIELPGRINNTLTKSVQTNIGKYLKKYRLTQFTDFYPNEISGGMKQKVALIRAIVYKPQIIVLDEPFSALDAITRMEMQQMLADLWHDYKPTILCVTHDIDEAIFLSDRIFVLSARPGKIIKTIDTGLTRPRTLDDISTPKALKLKKSLRGMLLV